MTFVLYRNITKKFGKEVVQYGCNTELSPVAKNIPELVKMVKSYFLSSVDDGPERWEIPNMEDSRFAIRKKKQQI